MAGVGIGQASVREYFFFKIVARGSSPGPDSDADSRVPPRGPLLSSLLPPLFLSPLPSCPAPPHDLTFLPLALPPPCARHSRPHHLIDQDSALICTARMDMVAAAVSLVKSQRLDPVKAHDFL